MGLLGNYFYFVLFPFKLSRKVFTNPCVRKLCSQKQDILTGRNKFVKKLFRDVMF